MWDRSRGVSASGFAAEMRNSEKRVEATFELASRLPFLALESRRARIDLTEKSSDGGRVDLHRRQARHDYFEERRPVTFIDYPSLGNVDVGKCSAAARHNLTWASFIGDQPINSEIPNDARTSRDRNDDGEPKMNVDTRKRYKG